MYSRVVFWRRYVLGESEEKAMSQPLNPTLEMYVRCYFESDWGRLRLATLRLRREMDKALKLDKIVELCKKLSYRWQRLSKKVGEWALSNGFEERNGVGYCRRLPFGFAYLNFKGEELEMTITAEGLDKGRLMASEKQPLYLALHCDLDDWLLHWLKCMLYKYVDELLDKDKVE